MTFQSTLPREERRCTHAITNLTAYFNPRSHERSDNYKPQQAQPKLKFQSTLPREERHYTFKVCYGYMIFQSTLPREERPTTANSASNDLKFQSTLPREERHASMQALSTAFEFQSTLPREERQARQSTLLQTLHFNPRSHERSDRRGNQLCYRLYISIHAPTRGATHRCLFYVSNALFQSTLPREERQQYCTKNLFIFIQYRQ